MTPRQARLLDFITAFHRNHGMAPTIREMTTGLSYSGVGTVHGLVKLLIEQRHLRRTKDGARNIALVDPLAAISTDLLRAEIKRREERVA